MYTIECENHPYRQSLRKHQRESPENDVPTPKGNHGGSLDGVGTEQLLDETRDLFENEKVNWSELARRYGLQQANVDKL